MLFLALLVALAIDSGDRASRPRWQQDRMRAIVFDLFGTLADPRAEIGRRAAFRETAAALGVPPDRFWTAMAGPIS